MNRYTILLTILALMTGCATSPLKQMDSKALEHSHNQIVLQFAPEVITEKWTLLNGGGMVAKDGQHYQVNNSLYRHPEDPDDKYRFVRLEYWMIDGKPRIITLIRGFAKRVDSHQVIEETVIIEKEKTE